MTETAAPGSRANVPAISEIDKRNIVVGALISMLLAALDQTIVAPALPTIGATLGDPEWLSWVISAYFLTATAVTPLYGKLADIRGRRPVLFAAVGIFLAASVACALAPNMGVLIAGRALQGLGGGGLIALAQTIIGDVVPPRERPRYVTYITGVWATASLAGPVVGGLFAQHIHWSLIFWINLPLGAVALFLSERTLRKLPRVQRNHQLDWPGSLMVVGATVMLMLALTLGGHRLAWLSAGTVGLLLGAVALAGLFLWHQTRAAEPLIPPRVMRNPVIAPMTLGLFFAMASSIGLSVYFPVYLELVEGMGPANAGFALVVYLGGTVAGANLSGRVIARVERYEWVAIVGGLVAAVALFGLAAGAGLLPFWAVELAVGIAGMGTGTLFPVGTISVQNAAEPRDLGVATASMSFLRTLGSVVGVTVLGAILTGTGVVAEIGEGARHAAVDPAIAARAVDSFRWVFLVAAIAQTIAVAILSRAEHRPLRGNTASTPGPAAGPE